MVNRKVPFFYVYIYSKVKEKSQGLNYIPTKVIVETIARVVHHIPKFYHHIIIKELESYGLIKKIDHIKCQINEKKVKTISEKDAINNSKKKLAENYKMSRGDASTSLRHYAYPLWH